jgi:hypothetical protein
MKIARFLFYATTFLGVSVISHALNRHALARDFGQYANAELTDAAKQRLHWKKCCDLADVVKTRFRVNKSNGDDEWYWLREGQWKRIPPDIIHWGVSAPGRQPVLFVYSNVETCFFPGREGIRWSRATLI